MHSTDMNYFSFHYKCNATVICTLQRKISQGPRETKKKCLNFYKRRREFISRDCRLVTGSLIIQYTGCLE